MKQYLLPENGQFYKANLHCHSTISDGKLTPDELKAEYKKRGYSVVAFTDHNILVPHPELQSEDFVALYGMEYDFTEEIPNVPSYRIRTSHLCLIALTPENVIQPCFYYPNWFYDQIVALNDPRYTVTIDKSVPFYERSYTPECVNDVIKTAREKGFFVTYNHPKWAKEGYEIYSKYRGMNAMEICNFGQCVIGFDDYNGKVYDEKLRNGEQLYAIAADDNHNEHPLDSPYCDSFGGFTMIKAEKLDYCTITDALLKGSFYASQGPEIHSLYVEDNKLHIKTSDAARIVFTTGVRHSFCQYPMEGDHINQAEFEIRPDDLYVRVTVFDKTGKAADTNAYFVENLLK